jgi:glutamyl-tRNA synthetase
MPLPRLRFSPSPTGYLHIGSLRTVLFTYLTAKSLGGKLILRIEDTDQKREVEGAVEKLLEILDWTGMKFDEGPHVGGDFGPYVQTQRLDIYREYADLALKNGVAYRCFCTPERLEAMREKQQADKKPPRYDRTCRDLSDDEANEHIKNSEKFVIRQKMPLSGDVIVHDELRGDIKFNAGDLDDQVLVKSNGVPTYQFAVVIDDHLMGITHVTRADEWIPSFPKNLLLYRAFGWDPPKFIHFPVILNRGGGKLSKRQGDVSVEEYRDKGYLVEALLNFCSLLGWHPKDDTEIMSQEEIISKFNYTDIGISPAIFDIEKLDFFNGAYIRKLEIQKLARLCLPFLEREGLIEIQDDNSKYMNALTNQEIDYDFILKVVSLEQERLKKLSDIGGFTRFFFEDELVYDPELLIWKKMDQKGVKENLQYLLELLEMVPLGHWSKDAIETAVMDNFKTNDLKVGEYLWPMRVALTGCQASPGPFEVAEALGKEATIKRIKSAINRNQS